MSIVYRCKCGSSRRVQSPPVKFEPEQGKKYVGGEPDERMWLCCDGACNGRNVNLDASDGWMKLGKRPYVHTYHELVAR